MARLRSATLERLIRCYWHASVLAAKPAATSITSSQLGEALDIDPSQIRRDFGEIGLRGVTRIGYDLFDVCRTIRAALGFDHAFAAVLVGTGHLGTALLSYEGFWRYGLLIVAAFDNDESKVGRPIAKCRVRHLRELADFVSKSGIRLGIVATPADVSQDVANILVSAGVTAIWNFSPTPLTVPSGVLTRNEPISAGLAEIAYHLKPRTAGARRVAATAARHAGDDAGDGGGEAETEAPERPVPRARPPREAPPAAPATSGKPRRGPRRRGV